MSGQPDNSDDLIAELAKLMATNAKGEATASASSKVATGPDGKPIIRIPGLEMPPLTVSPFESRAARPQSAPSPAAAAPQAPKIAPAQPAAQPPKPAPQSPAAAQPAAPQAPQAKAPEPKPAEAKPVATEPKPVPAEPKPVVAESKSATAEPRSAAAAESKAPAPKPVAPTIRIPGMDMPPLQESPAPVPSAKADTGKPAPVTAGAAGDGAPKQAPAESKPAIHVRIPGAPEPRPVQQRPAQPVPSAAGRFEPRVVAEQKPANDAQGGKTPGEPSKPAPAPAASQFAFSSPRNEPRIPGQPAPGGAPKVAAQGGGAPQRVRDPIAELIAADLDAAERAPAQPADRPLLRPISVPAAAAKPAAVAPRPAAGPIPGAQRPAAKAPIPLKPQGLTAKQVPPESDAFFVAPVFGAAKAEATPPTHPAADPMDEIESLIGEAVRVEVGGQAGQDAAPAAKDTQPQQRGPKPVAVPAAPLPQPRRAGIKQHENEAVPQSAEAAILAAAAASGAEVGRIEPAVATEAPNRRQQFRPARGRRPMSSGVRQYVGMAVAGVLLLAAGLGLYWVLGMGRVDPATAPVLTADASPVKEAPPPVTDTAETRSPVMDQIDGVATPPGQETLAPEPATDTAAVASANTDETSESGLANRKVRTVTVRPDGTIVATDDAIAGAEPLPVARPNVPEVPGADVQPSDLLTAAATSPAPAAATAPATTPAVPKPSADPIASMIASSESSPPSSVSALAPTTNATPATTMEPAPAVTAELAPGATPIPSDVVAPTPMPRPSSRASLNGQPSRSVTAEIRSPQPTLGTALTKGGQAIDLLAGNNSQPAAQPATAAAQPAATAAAYVQLSSQRSEDDARTSLRNISARYANLFGGNQAEVHRADLGAKGIYYRVMLPAGSRSEATTICGKIKSAGGECFVP